MRSSNSTLLPGSKGTPACVALRRSRKNWPQIHRNVFSLDISSIIPTSTPIHPLRMTVQPAISAFCCNLLYLLSTPMLSLSMFSSEISLLSAFPFRKRFSPFFTAVSVFLQKTTSLCSSFLSAYLFFKKTYLANLCQINSLHEFSQNASGVTLAPLGPVSSPFLPRP
jgi:hypothetical protein